MIYSFSFDDSQNQSESNGWHSFGSLYRQIKNGAVWPRFLFGSFPADLVAVDQVLFGLRIEEMHDLALEGDVHLVAVDQLFALFLGQVDGRQAEDDVVILHEMIHLHEYVLNDLPLYYHDMVYWALYKNLRNKIPDLDCIITEHAHALNENELYRTGGLHDILFLLKSFDLDIRKGFPLGTVFGYGRVDEFKNYKYKDEQQ